MTTSYAFSTRRLTVDDWHSRAAAETSGALLVDIVPQLLTSAVTQDLPPDWRGSYTSERAQQWIADRDQESTVLLVSDRRKKMPVGLLLLTEDEPASVRLGYLIAEKYWGKGLASELVSGLVDRCRKAGITTLLGGVAHSNAASCRVLEKNGFTRRRNSSGRSERIYQLALSADH